jgi:hypothetical protein
MMKPIGRGVLDRPVKPGDDTQVASSRRAWIPSRVAAQRRIEAAWCDKITRRANHQKSVQPFAQKYSAGAVGQINATTPRILSHQGASAIVANEGQGAVDAKVATDERDQSVR